jgi:hypothetical protein
MADAQISDQKRQLQDQGSNWSRQQQWQNERAHNTARRVTEQDGGGQPEWKYLYT